MKTRNNKPVNKIRIGLTVIWLLLFVMVLRLPSSKAQTVDPGWSQPYRLSKEGTISTEGFMVADQFGYVHLFWYEYDPQSNLSTLQYSNFDGIVWTDPVDIFVIPVDARAAKASPFVDEQGTLHLIWSDSPFGPVNYSYAPAHEATSAWNWQKPIRLNISATYNKLVVDSKGVIHILYGTIGADAGIYYIRSEDNGITWQGPIWLDPDILAYYHPGTLEFAIDEADGLHAVWYYESDYLGPDWVRYAHSMDGGESWSLPFTIDRDLEGVGRLQSSEPVMIVDGEDVHVIWASEIKRLHRYSSDRGLNWSSPVRIMSDLEGQAFDGLAIDGAGRVHFMAQVRSPTGIYHTYLEQDGWSLPSLVYLVQGLGEESIGDRIHAHNVNPVVRAGNQLVVTFADEPPNPERTLYFIESNLSDIPESMVVPRPPLTPTPEVNLASPTPMLASPTIIPHIDTTPVTLPLNVRTPLASLVWAVVPVITLVAGFITLRIFIRRLS